MLAELILASAIGYDKPINKVETACMARAIYFEARNQPIAGQVAVAVTILNRLNSFNYPNTICKVVYQPNQFSFTLMPLEERKKLLKPNNPIDKISIRLSVQIALQAVVGGFDDMHVAQHYFNPSLVTPKWSRTFNNSFTIKDHMWVY